MKTIGEKISSSFSRSAMQTVSKEDIDNFFGSLPESVVKKWPYDLEKKGFTTNYNSAVFHFGQNKLQSRLFLEIEMRGPTNGYLIKRCFSFEQGAMNIEFMSLQRTYGQPSETSHLITDKHRDFLKAYDKTRGLRAKVRPSKAVINAVSGTGNNGVRLNGAYTWANQGFSFATPEASINMRIQFKAFLQKKGIELNGNDLKLFKQPCHYAAFDIGKRFPVNALKDATIGEAFLYNASWEGKWDTSHSKAVEKRYSKRYNDLSHPKRVRKKSALMSLGSRYYKMCKKYGKIYGGKEKQKRSISSYVRLAKMKMNNLASGF